MKRLIALGAVTLGVVMAVKHLPRESRVPLGDVVRRRMFKRMERAIASLPENAPPKLVMAVLPRLQSQNEQIIALLREQNDLLRKQLRAA